MVANDQMPSGDDQQQEPLRMAMFPIATDKVATPVGPYSIAAQGVATLYLSGQVAQDPATGKLVDGDASVQAERIFENIALVLEAAGKSFSDVIRAGVYLRSMDDFAAVNRIYGRYFKPPYPARTAIAVAALPLGALVEVDLVVG
jgi:2-iminobutanoate/2-iminopropanoate deaminase